MSIKKRLIRSAAQVDFAIERLIGATLKHDVVFDSMDNECVAMTVDGQDLVDEDFDKALAIIAKLGLISSKQIIIPAKSEVIKTDDLGNAYEMTFDVNGHTVICDWTNVDEDDFDIK